MTKNIGHIYYIIIFCNNNNNNIQNDEHNLLGKLNGH